MEKVNDDRGLEVAVRPPEAEKAVEAIDDSEIVDIKSILQLSKFAVELKKFIVKAKLFSNIKGKNYVNVEGWEFAGAATGIIPMVRSVVDQSDPETKEIKYMSEVELRNQRGEVVGFGMAICSNKEQRKKSFDEYAIASMAQTRAIGKAYRNKLAFVMKMAGYEPTPAEEAQGTINKHDIPAPEEKKATAKKLKVDSKVADKIGGEK